MIKIIKHVSFLLFLLIFNSFYGQVEVNQMLTEKVINTTTKSFVQLVPKNTVERKKMVLLLPFNLLKNQGDSLNSINSILKKDKFLNMTLDFYSGALMAIDSAKTMGVPVDISIFDSQETKTSSEILNIHQQQNLNDFDAIIGPFYQTHLEKLASLMQNSKPLILSPLSKEVGLSYANLVQTIPSLDHLKKAVFDFMIAKKGTIIAVVDKKKESARQFIQQNYNEVKFAQLQENGTLLSENLKKLLVKDKINYVVLASENTGLIKLTMSTLISVLPNYKIQLVIMEPNETLDTDEINFDSLVKLKLLYPSISYDNETNEAKIFKKEYRKKNKIAPNAIAIRGFDLTFDTLMRLSQGMNFQETADLIITQQIENKFEYVKKNFNGYLNNGIYIVQYDSDLTVKIAK